MKFGTLYAYWTHEWTGDYKYFAKKVADIGFDILEISAGDLITMSDNDVDELKAISKDLGIEITSNIGPAKKYDVDNNYIELQSLDKVDLLHQDGTFDVRMLKAAADEIVNTIEELRDIREQIKTLA